MLEKKIYIYNSVFITQQIGYNSVFRTQQIGYNSVFRI